MLVVVKELVAANSITASLRVCQYYNYQESNFNCVCLLNRQTNVHSLHIWTSTAIFNPTTF